MKTNGSPPLLKETEAADRLGVSFRTLQGWRTTGKGPVFVRLGSAVRYAPGDLDTFIQEGRRILTRSNHAA